MSPTSGNRALALLECWVGCLRRALTISRASSRCSIPAACLLLFITCSVGAKITDCIGANSDAGVPGQAICTAPISTRAQGVPTTWADSRGWTYKLCDEAGEHFLREKAWCESAGGTYMGLYTNPSCVGAS